MGTKSGPPTMAPPGQGDGRPGRPSTQSAGSLVAKRGLLECCHTSEPLNGPAQCRLNVGALMGRTYANVCDSVRRSGARRGTSGQWGGERAPVPSALRQVHRHSTGAAVRSRVDRGVPSLAQPVEMVRLEEARTDVGGLDDEVAEPLWSGTAYRVPVLLARVSSLLPRARRPAGRPGLLSHIRAAPARGEMDGGPVRGRKRCPRVPFAVAPALRQFRAVGEPNG